MKERSLPKEELQEIQRLVYYLVPEKWEKIRLYASFPGKNNKGIKGELFFYYLPKGIFKNQYINCYEIPGIFNINEREYIELISKLYNKLLILRASSVQKGIEFTNITISIYKGKMTIDLYDEDIVKSKYNSYQRHVIWRFRYLGIYPKSLNGQKLVDNYFKTNEAKMAKEVFVEKIENEKITSILEFEKVLTAEEAIARSIAEVNKREKTEEKVEKIKFKNQEMFKVEKNIKRVKEIKFLNLFNSIFKKKQDEKLF